MSSVNLASSLPVEVRVILIVAFGKRNRVFSQHFGFSITPLSPYTKYVCPLNVQVLVLIASTYSCKNCRLVIQDKSVIRGSWPWQWYHYKLRFHLQTKFKSDWAQGECIIGPCCHLCLSHSPLAALFWKCNMGNTWKGKNTNHHIFIALEFKLVRATAIQKL